MDRPDHRKLLISLLTTIEPGKLTFAAASCLVSDRLIVHAVHCNGQFVHSNGLSSIKRADETQDYDQRWMLEDVGDDLG